MGTHARWRVLPAAALALILVLSGCATQSQRASLRRTPSQYWSDKQVELRVKRALFADPDVSGFDVQVNVHRGWVQLTGFVDTEQARERAAGIASLTPGVSALRNDLIRKGEAPPLLAGAALTPTGREFGALQRRAMEPPAGRAAFRELLLEAGRHLTHEERGMLLEARSEPSADSLHPSRWTLVFGAPKKSQLAEARFEEGTLVELVRKPATGSMEGALAIPQESVRVNSTDALHRALSALPDLLPASASLRLHSSEPSPRWEVLLWKKEGEQLEGQVIVSALSGEILQAERVGGKASSARR